MPITTYNKNHEMRGVKYDVAATLGFGTITVAASQANTAIQAYVVLPFNYKIFGAYVVASSGSSGVTAFNVVNGTGTENGVANTSDNSDSIGWPPTTVPAGGALFTSDTAVTLAAYTPQGFSASVFDAVWAKGSVLTLRLVSGASIAGTIRVELAGKIYDVLPTVPSEYNRPLQFSDL